MHAAKLTLELLLGYFAVSFLSGGAWIALVKLNGRRAVAFPCGFAPRAAWTATMFPRIHYLPCLGTEWPLSGTGHRIRPETAAGTRRPGTPDRCSSMQGVGVAGGARDKAEGVLRDARQFQTAGKEALRTR
jgi:hypothetical protein